MASAYAFDEVTEDVGLLSVGGGEPDDDEVDAILTADADEGTVILDYLPPKHITQYDLRFLRRFLVCIVVVGQRLREEGLLRFACVGEQLAFRYIADTAREYGKEIVEWSATDEEAFYAYCEDAVEDTDIEFLFDPSMDGIEDDPTLGMRNLAFAAWFTPFSPDLPVHPYLDPEDEEGTADGTAPSPD